MNAPAKSALPASPLQIHLARLRKIRVQELAALRAENALLKYYAQPNRDCDVLHPPRW